MKATPPPAKRRRGPRLAVLALVFCSLLVPIAFLFNRFPAVYVTDERPQQEIDLPSFGRMGLERSGGVTVVKPEDGSGANAETKDTPEMIHRGGINSHHHSDNVPSKVSANPKVPPPPKIEPLKPKAKSVPVPVQRTEVISGNNMRPAKVQNADDVEKAKACQLEFGSYCLWSIEHKEVMKDTIVKRLKDQLFVARSYYPSIAKLKGKEALTRGLKQNIQEHERVLSESIVDADLPSFIKSKIEKMDQTIGRAKACTVDCNNVDRKLRQILHMTEDEAHFHMKQSAYLYNLGVHTMPKSHHCLNMRLTVEYFKSVPLDSDDSAVHKFNVPDHRHYVILSKNVLAASVVINSTVSNSEETENVIVLDDDVVVQRDLSFLWNIDMGDKVNGAVKFCGLRMGQLRNLLGKATYDPQSCAWMSGVNVIDLEKWREHNVTENYLQLLKKFQHNDDEAPVRAAALPISLLAFEHLIYPLDERLTISGLGYDYAIKEELVRNSVSLHYNGNMKPWLELGIPDYRKYWKRFLTRDERFMDECNVSP
uniref:Hexosyltransferase n=1 Tax=Oryza meridionalis TaxID=40149 RepID=A0A0E0CZY9_9ORYZ